MRKQLLSTLLALCMALALLPGTARAADTSGLAAFTDSNQYADGTFADVSDAAWYAPSVKTVYEKDIMGGTGGGKFDPDSTMLWSQAVTIAVRLHAIYHSKNIPVVNGPWYAQYLEYARDNNLLPATCPDDADTDTVPITREDLAVLFRSVLDEEDLPVINDQPIPDLNEIREEYQDAVSDMFASGIFTGIDSLFDPDGEATRAQVATIITRLLCPGQRVSHDSRQNPNMADQMGNFYNGGLCVRVGDTVYYLYNEPREDSPEEYSQHHAIFARSDSGQVRQVYAYSGSENHAWKLLSVGPDGLLYFVQRTYSSRDSDILDNLYILKQLDPMTGATKDVYTTENDILIYLFYDNELYVCDSGTQIGRVTGGKMATLATIPPGWEDLYVKDTLYCFGGKMYWRQIAPRDSMLNGEGDDHLMILDLETGKTDAIVSKAGQFAYQGATAWAAEYRENNMPMVLKRISLAMPELAETIRILDGDLAGPNNLFANGSQLYCLSRGVKKLWTVSPSGQVEEEIATAQTVYCEGASVTSQGAVIMPLKYNYSGNIVYSQIDFVFPDGQKKPMPAVLNKPYFLKGEGQLAATDDQAAWEPVGVGKDVSKDVIRAYVTPDDEVAIEFKVTDLRSEKISISYLTPRLSGSVKGEASFRTFTDLESGESAVFTFVFPKGTVEVIGPMENIEAGVTVFGSIEED